jgi:hypothetical protein
LHAGFTQQQCLPPSNGFCADTGSLHGSHVESAPPLQLLQLVKSSHDDWLLPEVPMAMVTLPNCLVQPSCAADEQQRLPRQHLQHEQHVSSMLPLAAAALQTPSPLSTPEAVQQETLQLQQVHAKQRQAEHDPIADLLGCDWLLDPEAADIT